MLGIIVTGHGHFATGLVSAATLITGTNEGIIACDFDDMSNFNSIREKLEKAVEQFKDYDGIAIFCDLLSGTPYNQAIDLKVSTGNDKIQIIYGTNLPLLIEASIARNNEATMEDIFRIVENASMSIGKVEMPSSDDDDDF